MLKNQVFLDCFQETKTMVFKTKEEAQRTGAVSNGWLPLNLPPSASRIHENHNWDYNRSSIISFTDSIKPKESPAMTHSLLEAIISERASADQTCMAVP